MIDAGIVSIDFMDRGGSPASIIQVFLVFFINYTLLLWEYATMAYDGYKIKP